MSYGTVYVASVAMGAKDEHTLKAFLYRREPQILRLRSLAALLRSASE